MENEPLCVYHFWKAGKIGRFKNKQTDRQKESPYFIFYASISQICPKCQFLCGKIFFKQINQQLVLSCPFKIPWERMNMKPHKGLKSKSAAGGVIWGLAASQVSHLFGTGVLSGCLLFELSCWSELNCQNITSNYRFGSQLSEWPPSSQKTPMPWQTPCLWKHILWCWRSVTSHEELACRESQKWTRCWLCGFKINVAQPLPSRCSWSSEGRQKTL